MRLKSLHYCHFTHHRLADQCQILAVPRRVWWNLES